MKSKDCSCSCFRSSDHQQDVSNGPAILTLAHTGVNIDVHAIKPSKRARIVIPTVESQVDSLTSTTYTSTAYSTTYTFNVAVSTSSLSKV